MAQDTYAFSKATGKVMIDKLSEDIPVVVILPSVIESTFREPLPGWKEGNRYVTTHQLFFKRNRTLWITYKL